MSILSWSAAVAVPPPAPLEHGTRPQTNDRRLGTRRRGLALKRSLDLIAAIVLLLLLCPLMLALAFAVWFDGGPVFYRHIRIGFRGQPFSCLKYRTMRENSERDLANHLAGDPLAAAEWSANRKLTCDPRVTRLGALLRATSLDELPQLLNVVRGQMSLVGPRPVVREELERHYGLSGAAAYAAGRPGITGLWQVSGRSDTSYQKRVALDLAYVSSRSFLVDLKILLRAVPAVLARRGAL